MMEVYVKVNGKMGLKYNFYCFFNDINLNIFFHYYKIYF